MLRVDIQPRQIIAPLFLGIATYFIYTEANGAPMPLAAVAALAAAIHMTNLGLRDATFKELIGQSRVGTKDLIARCCMVVFDAILLFGILTAAGLALPWPLFISLVIGLAVVLPIVVFLMTRSARADAPSQTGLPLDYWAPLAFLLLMAALLSLAGTMVVTAGSQPFVSLVLLSSIFAINRSGSRLVGRARVAGFASLAATLVLLAANYLLLS